jgi:hypothetical protein
MMDTLVVVIATGLSLGYMLGYRASKLVFLRVSGPFARKPLIVGFVAAGSFLFLVPATMFMILAARNLELGPDGPTSSGSPVVMAGIALGIALIIASGLVVAVFASSVCGRFIEEVRSGRRAPDDD